MNGTVAGMTTDRNRQPLATRRSCGRRREAAVRRPHALHRRDDDREERAQEARRRSSTRARRPPNMITSTGSSAMRGSELKKFSHGSRRVLEAAEPAGRQPDRDAEHDGQHVADRELREAGPEVAPEARRLDLGHAGLDDRRSGRLKKHAVDDPGPAAELPEPRKTMTPARPYSRRSLSSSRPEGPRRPVGSGRLWIATLTPVLARGVMPGRRPGRARRRGGRSVAHHHASDGRRSRAG